MKSVHPPPANVVSRADADLVREIADGSQDALGCLYDAHAGIVYGIAKRILSNPEDAQEVVQDVFVQVWREASRYQRDRASVAGWLVMLTRARAIDRLRARRARPDQDRAVDPAPIVRFPSANASPEGLALSAEDVERVERALVALPSEQRVLIGLAYFSGLSQSEIAAKTNAPLGTIKTRMRTALHSLRGALSS